MDKQGIVEKHKQKMVRDLERVKGQIDALPDPPKDVLLELLDDLIDTIADRLADMELSLNKD